MRTPRRAPVAAVLLAGALAACSPQDAARDAADRAAERAPGQTSATADVAADGELPVDFPVDVVPLVEGAIGSSVATRTDTGTAWIVAVQADGVPPQDAKGAARQLLLDAGFAEPEELTGLGMSVLEKEGYQVLLAAGEQDGATVVNYTVTQR